jgi:dTDP-4-dehydrorhamnose reductase
MTAAGETTWAGFARAIFETSSQLGGPSANVRGITTAEYPTRARRPGNSRLDSGKLAAAYGIRLPDWRISTEAVVRQLFNKTT